MRATFTRVAAARLQGFGQRPAECSVGGWLLRALRGERPALIRASGRTSGNRLVLFALVVIVLISP